MMIINEDASKLITKLARLTAKTDFGKSMSPLVTHSRKGGAFPIMQSQFRRCRRVLNSRGQRHSTCSKGDMGQDRTETGMGGCAVGVQPVCWMECVGLWSTAEEG